MGVFKAIAKSARESFLVDKALFPTNKERILLYSSIVLGFALLIYSSCMLRSPSSVTLVTTLLGFCLVLLPCTQGVSRANKYILNKEQGKED